LCYSLALKSEKCCIIEWTRKSSLLFYFLGKLEKGWYYLNVW
jgi:hypothetical protein